MPTVGSLGGAVSYERGTPVWQGEEEKTTTGGDAPDAEEPDTMADS